MKPIGSSAYFSISRTFIFLFALMIASKLTAQTGSIVTVNADHALVINGRKVFPIGFSPGPPTNGKTPDGGDALDELRSAGSLLIRMTQTNNWNSQMISNQQATLDWAGQHGMYVWVNLRELSKFSATDTNTPASLRNIVNTFKNHPAVGLWKNFDEAWWGGISEADLQRGYEVIKQEDANHPVVQTHAPRGTLSDLQPYDAAADVLALDIYPVGVPPGANSLLANKEISMVGDYAQFLDQVGNGQKQFWMIEQIAWSGVTPPNKTLVFPTPRQSRYMAYQAIINGARGLMFFGGTIAATLNTQDAALGWNWTFWNDVLKSVVQELGDNSLLAEALVAPASVIPIAMSGTVSPDLEFCVREVLPYLYLLASKREGATTNITFSGLPMLTGIGEVLYENSRTVTVQNGQFTDSFAPFDVHVYRFALTTQSSLIISQPQNRTNYPATTATFSVTANGASQYQWKKNGIDLSDGGNISGATTSTLTLTGVTSASAGNYSVVVFNAGGFQFSSNATLSVVYPMPYYEPFNYFAGTNLGGQTNGNFLVWSDIGTSTAGPFVTVQNDNLSVPGLAPSLGHSLRFGGLGKSVRFSFPPGNFVTSGTLYYSFALQVLDTNGLTSSGIFIGGFNNLTGTQTNQPTVIGTRVYIRSTTNGFNLGVAKASSTVTDWVWDPHVFRTNEVLFIVGSYTFGAANSSNDISKMWINPDPTNFSAMAEPATALMTTNGSDISSAQIQSFIFVQRLATEPAAMLADELRIGKTWADVTPILLPTLTDFSKLGAGTFQFSYTNSSFQTYNVYSSTNLLDWISIGAATEISPGAFRFTDATANSSQRFYQLRAP